MGRPPHAELVPVMGRLERHLDLQKVAQVLHAHPEIERPRAHPIFTGPMGRLEGRWPSRAYRAKLKAKRRRRQHTTYAATGR
jgi:hypothetical protein